MEEKSVIKYIDDNINTLKEEPTTLRQRWESFCKRHNRTIKTSIEEVTNKETFKAYDTLKKRFTSSSVLTCPKCKKNEINCISRQISRADESEDFFATCLNSKCRYKWRFK